MLIDLDRNATTPLCPEARAAMIAAMGEGNPSSLHQAGRRARRCVEEAREAVAALFEARPGEVVFTSGATEANRAALGAAAAGSRGAVLVLAIEHASVLEPAKELFGSGLQLLPVDAVGRCDEAALETALQRGVDAVFIQAANNETGVLQPIQEIADRCAARDIPLHVDAAQIPGKLPLDPLRFRFGTVAISAHKFGGPKGAGALIRRGEVRVPPWLRGGGQERGFRSGTENVVGIAGLGAAAARLAAEGPMTARLAALEQVFLEALAAEDLAFFRFGPQSAEQRLPGTIAVRLPGRLAQSTMMQLDLAGILVSVGAACSSGAAKPSHVLQAMGVPLQENLETIRVSLGPDLREADLRRAASALARLKS